MKKLSLSTALKQVSIRGKIYNRGNIKSHKKPKGKKVKLRIKSRERLPFTAFFVALKGVLLPFKNSHKYQRSTEERRINNAIPATPKRTLKVFIRVVLLPFRKNNVIDGITDIDKNDIIKNTNLRLKNKQLNSVAKDE